MFSYRGFRNIVLYQNHGYDVAEGRSSETVASRNDGGYGYIYETNENQRSIVTTRNASSTSRNGTTSRTYMLTVPVSKYFKLSLTFSGTTEATRLDNGSGSANAIITIQLRNNDSYIRDIQIMSSHFTGFTPENSMKVVYGSTTYFSQSIAESTEHEVEVEYLNGTITIYLNGTEVYSYEDQIDNVYVVQTASSVTYANSGAAAANTTCIMKNIRITQNFKR